MPSSLRAFFEAALTGTAPARRRVIHSHTADAGACMNLEQVIGELYLRGIDGGLESYRGGGIAAWVVNDRNQRIEKSFAISALDAVAQWLHAEASRQRESKGLPKGEPDVHRLLAELGESARKGPRRVNERTDRRKHASSGADP